jgi:hypothetical protein
MASSNGRMMGGWTVRPAYDTSPSLSALVAAVLCLLVPRVPARTAAAVGLVGTGLAFTWVKATTAGAEFASAAWSVRRRCSPT